MSDLLDLRRFHALPDHEKAIAMQAFDMLARMAVSYTRPILFGRKPDGSPHTASGFLIVLDRPFLVTARHNMTSYEACAQADPTSPFQFGRLPFSPTPRRVDVDKDIDIAIVSLEGLDIGLTTARPYTPAPGDWPPPLPDAATDSVIVSGLPVSFRSYHDPDLSLGAYPLFAPVSVAREGYIACQVSNATAIIGPGDDGIRHDPETNLEAMSGGPVLRLGRGSTYPIVGVMSEYNKDFEIIRIAHLGAVRSSAWL